MTLATFLERHPNLDHLSALAVWNAAIDAAYEQAMERAEAKRAHVYNREDEIGQEHAAAGFLESRQVASLIYMLKARA